LREKGEGIFGFGDVLPETSLRLKVEKKSYQSRESRKPQYYQSVTLTISADTETVFGFLAPGRRFVEIRLDLNNVEEGVRFMRDLVHELDAVFQGKHPTRPASCLARPNGRLSGISTVRHTTNWQGATRKIIFLTHSWPVLSKPGWPNCQPAGRCWMTAAGMAVR
jgi:hypothetical protein